MPHLDREPKDPLVSVIVPNNDRDLTRLTASIRTSTYKNTELIEVNEGMERSIQRNIGICRATGEYLLFLDSDQTISPDLIDECLLYMEQGVDGVYIPEVIKTQGFFGYLRNWERQFYTSTPIDVVRFVRKGCPYFDNTMSGPEDSDWDRRVGGEKATTQSPLYHYDNIGVIDYFKKKAYYSKSMKRFAEKYPNDLTLKWWWRCFMVFFEKGKWKRALMRPDLMLLVWVVIFIRGVIYLCKR